MESNLVSQLESSFINEGQITSLYTVQKGSKYGVVLEIKSQMGQFYVPVQIYKSRDTALQYLRRIL